MAVPALPLAPAPGRMYVDFEERLDFGRLRQYRLDRAKAAMENAGLGAICAQPRNIRDRSGIFWTCSTRVILARPWSRPRSQGFSIRNWPAMRLRPNGWPRR